MKKIIAAALFMACIAFSAQAQMAVKWAGSDGWGLATRYEQLFNKYSVQSLSGTIYMIDTVTPMPDMSVGIQFIIKTASNEQVTVHIGPKWYIHRQDMNLNVNDVVEIRGSRFSLNGKNVMAALEVRSKERVLMLRDVDGIPYWCGWRKRKM
jgi:uncharacterized protein (DUF779 family)